MNTTLPAVPGRSRGRQSCGQFIVGEQTIITEPCITQSLQERTGLVIIDVRLCHGKVVLIHPHWDKGATVPKQLRKVARQPAHAALRFGRGMQSFAQLRKLGTVPPELKADTPDKALRRGIQLPREDIRSIDVCGNLNDQHPLAGPVDNFPVEGCRDAGRAQRLSCVVATRERSMRAGAEVCLKDVMSEIHVFRMDGYHVFRTADLMDDALDSAHARGFQQLHEPV